MIELRLTRRKYRDKQVIGTMEVYKDNLFCFSLASLEQDWNNNKTSNSCIPKGSYIVKHYDSHSHPNSFKIQKTEPRTSILIHKGNYNTHTEGCILVGLTHSDINKDGYIDVVSSGDAMNKLTTICLGEKIILIDIS